MRNKRQSSRHHLYPKSRIKDGSIRNCSVLYDYTLRLWRDKHSYWHFLFGNMSIEEIIICLQRIQKLKQCPKLIKKGETQ